jgi:hypothetical protein
MPEIARTHNNIPGDPLNVALIGSEKSVNKAMLAAGWHPADPLTLGSLPAHRRRHRAAAPLHRRPGQLSVCLGTQNRTWRSSNRSATIPRQRHHVRFWRSKEVDRNGSPLWVGGATYDRKVGIQP